MSFPAYPAYKDSEVPWLGAVPSHWDIARFKNLLRERDARSESGSEELLSVSAYTGVTPKSDSTADGEFLTRAESLEGYKICKRNDLVMNIMLAWNRGLGVTKYEGIVSPAYCVFELGSDLHPDFCNYALRADEYTGYFKAHSAGVIDSRLRLYPDKFGALLCAYPPIAEQVSIIAFLDRETAKIDALVAEQERLIALLKEKRQAVISHAVTKGLNPNAPMKDSGIEWLGEIPAHWETLPLKAVSIGEGAVFIDGDWIESKDISEDGIRYITTGNVGEGFYKEQGSGFITDDTFVALNCTEVLPGDVLISRLNLPIGRACVVPDLGTRIVTSVDNVIVRAGDHVSRKFLTFLLSAKSFFAHTETLARGTTMQRISRTVLGNIRICLPTIDEQMEIAESLQEQTAGIDALVVEAQSAITLLQERRAALISAAVTGKIDVRGLAETSPELERA